MKEPCRIGCSGYYYPSWKGTFYPQGLSTRHWLEYYSTLFNTVELNGTFYRTPKIKDLNRYAEFTQDSFTFSVKMSRYITHILRMRDAERYVYEFQELIREGLGNKLGYFLFQFPASFQYTEENLDNLVQNIPHSTQNVVEFRHISWWNEEAKQKLARARLVFCNVDYPGLDSWFLQTTNTFYLRLHGVPDLFKSAYSTERLKELIGEFPKDCTSYTVYFNNTYYGHGYENAFELTKLLTFYNA